MLQLCERVKLEQTFRDFGCLENCNVQCHMNLMIGRLANCSRLFHFQTLAGWSLYQSIYGRGMPAIYPFKSKLARGLQKMENADLEFKDARWIWLNPDLTRSPFWILIRPWKPSMGIRKAEAGIYPHKSGRKSYHPLFVEGKSRLCLNARLREEISLLRENKYIGSGYWWSRS